MNLRRDVFQAIADPTRRAILLLVASQSMTAGAIASNFDTARPTVSKHLQILIECELLKQKQNGREIYYHINIKKMKEAASRLEYEEAARLRDEIAQLNKVRMAI